MGLITLEISVEPLVAVNRRDGNPPTASSLRTYSIACLCFVALPSVRILYLYKPTD